MGCLCGRIDGRACLFDKKFIVYVSRKGCSVMPVSVLISMAFWKSHGEELNDIRIGFYLLGRLLYRFRNRCITLRLLYKSTEQRIPPDHASRATAS